MNNKLNEVYKAYAEELNKFAEQYADGLSPQVRNDFQNLLYSQYNKEVKSILSSQTFVLKTKNKIYKRFLSASRRLNYYSKAENWYKSKMKSSLGNGILLEVLSEMLDFLCEENPTLFQCLLSQYVCTANDETVENDSDTAEKEVAETENKETSDVEVAEVAEKQDTEQVDKQENDTKTVENGPEEETKTDTQTDEAETNAETGASDGAETDKSALTAEEKTKSDYWKNRRKQSKK